MILNVDLGRNFKEAIDMYFKVIPQPFSWKSE